MLHNVVHRWKILASLILVVIVATAGAVAAFNPQPEPPARWVLGLAHEQALGLTAVNHADRGGCQAVFAFEDANGETLASHRLKISPGGFTTAEFHPPDPIKPDDGARLLVRGGVSPLTPNCSLSATLEVFDRASGRTTTALGDQ